jgi:hypothetical protein
MFFLWGRAAKNKRAALAIRDEAPTAVEALARMFVDDRIHIGLTGFREEYEDPWPSSSDQVGHFLTAVRLSFDARFLRFPAFPLLLGSWGDHDIPLRLTIGHEKKPDPPDITKIHLGTALRVLRHFRAQYQAATSEDVANFRKGKLDAIQLGGGLGNSIEDLRLSRKGWEFGELMRRNHFQSNAEVSEWIRSELARPRGSPTENLEKQTRR